MGIPGGPRVFEGYEEVPKAITAVWIFSKGLMSVSRTLRDISRGLMLPSDLRCGLRIP